MRTRLMTLAGVAALIVAAVVFFTLVPMTGAGQDSEGAATSEAPRTPWGDPDLQGIWTNEFDTPLQRPAQFADKEFFTEEERAELDKQRAALLGRDMRVERGSELDVAGAYNSVFMSMKRAGRRTSLIVDPPDGQGSTARRGSAAESGRRPRVPARASAFDRDVQG